MKRIAYKQLLIIPVCFSAVILFNACSSAQEITTATPAQITDAVNNNHWKFYATFVSPSYGSSKSLTTEYFVTTDNNKITVALPYYGKLNSASGALGGNPLDFTSTSFNLSKENRSNGGWRVTVKDPDPEVQLMVFTFFDNGSAQLSITMTNRTGISYTGKVTPLAS
jgi:hypothetical protein